ATEVPITDNVRSAIAVHHGLRTDRLGSSAEQIVGPAKLPAFDSASQRSRTVTEEQLVGSHGQIERSVHTEFLTAMVPREAVVGIPIQEVRPTLPRRFHGSRPCVRCLEADALS